MPVAEGARIKIEPLQLQHVYAMRSWGHHESPLFTDYNFPRLSDEEIKIWYKVKTSKKNKKSFAVLNETDRVIGYLTIRKINKIIRQATLGIVLDPNFVNRGYGTEALKTFLDYFFEHLNMNKMNLEVAQFNKRAIGCYEKCGFIKKKAYYRKLEDQEIDIFGDPLYRGIRTYFIDKRGQNFMGFDKMSIDYKTYQQIKNKKTVHMSVDMWKTI